MTTFDFNDVFRPGIDCDIDWDPELLEARLRLTIKDRGFDDAPEEANKWIESPQALLEWLSKHPKASAEICYWSLLIQSPDVDDIIELERFECPAGLTSAVEDFGSSRNADGFAAEWSFG